MMNIVGKRAWWYVIGATLSFASLVVLVLWGLHIGIDFTGGTLIELSFDGARLERGAIEERVARIGLTRVQVQRSGEDRVLIRTEPLTETQHDAVLSAFPETREERFETIGPTIGRELIRKTTIAVGLSLLMIIVYLAITFRNVGKELASWKYGCVAIVALAHDALIPLGVFAVLGRFAGVEVNAAFIAALLTIIGYSVNDSIIIFDRIRENFLTMRGVPFATVVNESVNQSFTRSINTTLTTLLALLAVVLFGGSSLRFFALALMVGIGVGAYSSIFLAAPLLVSWHDRSRH